MYKKITNQIISHPVLSIIGVVIAIFLVGIIITNQKEVMITNYPSQGEEVVVFGDSLVFGVGATDGNGVVPELERLLSYPVINLGVSGDTTADGLARINTLPESPKVVIIILGGNDVLRKVPEAEVYENMKGIINVAQDRGSIVALGSVKSSLIGEGSLTDEYEKIANDTGSIFLGNVLHGIFGDQSLMSDSIHPNNNGYRIMAERIAEKIKPYLE